MSHARSERHDRFGFRGTRERPRGSAAGASRPRRRWHLLRLAAELLVAVTILVLAAPPAQAQDLEAFDEARRAYERQSYERAVDRFRELLETGEPEEQGPLMVESRKYLAASYVLLGRTEAARKEFEQLLRAEPDYKLDPVAFPSEVYDVFERVRTRFEEERARERRLSEEREAKRRREEAERLIRSQERVAQLRELARTVVVEQRNSRWVAALPFGAGQFQNQDRGLGLFFAATEAILAVLSVTTGALHLAIRDEDPGADDDLRTRLIRLERFYRYTNWVSSGLLAGLAIAGVAEAQARFVPVHRTERTRALPEDLGVPGAEAAPSLEVSVGPGGLRLRF